MFRRRETSFRYLWPLVAIPLLGGAVIGTLLALASHVGGSKDTNPGASSGIASGSSSNELPPPPPAAQFGTPAEIGTAGDTGNPGQLYAQVFPSDTQTQERRVGGPPARFSGYTTWVRSVARVPAPPLVDGFQGSFLRVRVTIFNRDSEEQHVCACDFFVWSKTEGMGEAQVVSARSIAPYSSMGSGAKLDGDVYLYVGNARGPLFIVYRPDTHVPLATSQSEGVWRVPATAS